VGHVQDRWYVDRDGARVRTDRHGRGQRWRARVRTPDRGEVARSFARKVDAEQWVREQEGAQDRGLWIDPRAGRQTLEEWAGRWLAGQTFDASTREAVETRLRVHVLPELGHLELRALRPSTVQTWVAGRSRTLAPSTVRGLLGTLSTVLAAAVADGLLAVNPAAAASVKAPKVPGRRVVPWTAERVAAVIDGHPARWRAVPIVAAGCGLRQGEVFGLAVEDVDFLRRTVTVRRQVKLLHGRPVFGPPKGTRERDVPLPDAVAVALSEHLRAVPAVEVAAPWGELDGPERTVRLVFRAERGGPVVRHGYNRRVWGPALDAAGVPRGREAGMHQLRHYFASALLEGGVSIRAVASYLGHTDPAFSLRVYAHLMPEAEDRARAAADAALGGATARVRPVQESP
jgi:integrase